MALSSFANKTFTIAHVIDYPDIVCANQTNTMQIVLEEHPVSHELCIKELALDSANSVHVAAWKNAVNVAYDGAYDQITGMLYAPGEPQNGEDTYVPRNFCMNLQGTPAVRGKHLHVYVGPSLNGGGGDPDDGSWTGDTP